MYDRRKKKPNRYILPLFFSNTILIPIFSKLQTRGKSNNKDSFCIVSSVFNKAKMINDIVLSSLKFKDFELIPDVASKHELKIQNSVLFLRGAKDKIFPSKFSSNCKKTLCSKLTGNIHRFILEWSISSKDNSHLY